MSDANPRGSRAIEEAIKSGDERSKKSISQRRNHRSNNTHSQHEKQHPKGSVSSSAKRFGEAEDDLSNQYFLSDPSMSEEGHDSSSSSGNQRSQSLSGESCGSVEAPLQVDQSRTHPPPASITNPLLGRTSMLNNNSAGIYSSSPGNTSLSSWGSQHTRRQVQLSFEQSGGSANIPAICNHDNNGYRNNRETPTSNSPFLPNLGVTDGNQFNNLSSNSTSEASLNQQQKAQEFLDDLRQQSRGAMVVDQAGSSSAPSFATSSQGEDTYQHQIEGIMRHRRTPEDDHEEHDSVEGGRDDTVIMTLSASEEEKDSFDNSLLHDEQSHNGECHRSWMGDSSSQVANLQTVEEGILFEPTSNNDHSSQRSQQMATGEPTAVPPTIHQSEHNADWSHPRAAEEAISSTDSSSVLDRKHSESNLGEPSHPHLNELRSHRHGNMKAGDVSGSGSQHPNYPWVNRFGCGPDPSAMSQSLIQQPPFGSYKAEADWLDVDRSPNQMYHHQSKESLVRPLPSVHPQFQPSTSWSVQGDTGAVLPGSPIHGPHYFLSPQGELLQADPALVPPSPIIPPQYFVTPQGESVQADPAFLAHTLNQQSQYSLPSQGSDVRDSSPQTNANQHPRYLRGPHGEILNLATMSGSTNLRPQHFISRQNNNIFDAGGPMTAPSPSTGPSPNQPSQYLMSVPYYDDECEEDHSSDGSGSSETDENSGDEDGVSADDYMAVQQNRIWMDQNINNLEDAEKLLENPQYRGKMQHMLRRHSVFDNVGQAPETIDRSYFMPKTSTLDDDPKCATFTCPKCKMKQREFFSVASAPQQFETATSYLGLYFALYVIASLFIFGLKEGWSALDCIYFAVITLTTAGLGDFVPTSDDAKIICSIFIYFGVACIGLLLGSYIAGMLDDISHREAAENRIKSCPNCARIQHLKELAKQNGVAKQRRCASSRAVEAGFVNNLNDIDKNAALRRQSYSTRPSLTVPSTDNKPLVTAPTNDLPAIFEGNQLHLNHTRSTPVDTPELNQDGRLTADHHLSHDFENQERDSSSGSSSDYSENNDVEMAPPLKTTDQYASPSILQRGKAFPGQDPVTPPEIPASPNLLGSPLTREIMGRQHHTRHISFDTNANGSSRKSANSSGRYRQFSGDQNFWRNMSVQQPEPAAPVHAPPNSEPGVDDQTDSDENSEGSEEDSEDTVCEEGTTSSDESFIEKGDRGVHNARYVFLTLKEALVNSLLIIAVGSMGFFLIEGFTVVDSWYFTTVLLTTVGYGDICPVTSGGKLFATIYILVGGTVLINNMSMISMIPLELRKRRIERAVLTQFGDHLDDAALRELATGPLVQRLRLTPTRLDGLDECTREMFALAMLVRLGKVSEQDIKETFRAFRRLDVNNDGVLTSKSIIAGMIQKRRAMMQVPSQVGVNQSRHGAPHAGATGQPKPSAAPFTKGWLGPRGSFHALSQGGNSERTSLLTDSAIYDSISTNAGTGRGRM